jgi:molybdenum cofactor biosynthesis enzyme MoaA
MLGLENVWFQITGTLCNLRCTHCFISCGPDNHGFEFMSLEQVRDGIDQALELGVKEFYFTGGEPFMHPQIGEVLSAALRHRPTTVLTNAMLFRDAVLQQITDARDASGHEMTFRVSLDGHNAEMNDALRGEGVFDRTLDGVEQLVGFGFRPIITIVRTWKGCDDAVLAEFVRTLEGHGYREPRLKILPALQLGGQARRCGEYPPCARVTHEMMDGYDASQLLCSNSRLITDRGVWVCPILLDSPEARMGDTLAASMTSYPLRHAACFTCYQNGAICSNSETPCGPSTPAVKERCAG